LNGLFIKQSESDDDWMMLKEPITVHGEFSKEKKAGAWIPVSEPE